MLPKVRQEANEWRTAADSSARAADLLRGSVRVAHEAHDASQRAFVGQVALTNSKAAEASEYKKKAHRRGFVVYLLVVVDVVVGVLIVTH